MPPVIFVNVVLNFLKAFALFASLRLCVLTTAAVQGCGLL